MTSRLPTLILGLSLLAGAAHAETLRIGVTPGPHVQIFEAVKTVAAAWGAWVFDQYGLGDQVKLLDGGRKFWEKQALPLDTKAPA